MPSQSVLLLNNVSAATFIFDLFLLLTLNVIFVALCFFSSYADSWSLTRRWAKRTHVVPRILASGEAVRQVDAQMPENVDEYDYLATSCH